MEYYLAVKKNKVLVQAETWINLKIIMLWERVHTEESDRSVLLCKIYMKFWKGQSVMTTSVFGQWLEVREEDDYKWAWELWGGNVNN